MLFEGLMYTCLEHINDRKGDIYSTWSLLPHLRERQLDTCVNRASYLAPLRSSLLLTIDTFVVFEKIYLVIQRNLLIRGTISIDIDDQPGLLLA